MKKSNRPPLSKVQFRVLAIRVSKYINFKGCGLDQNRIYDRMIMHPKFIGLANAGFPFRLWFEAYINPDPVYKEMLGISDEDYEDLIEQRDDEIRRGIRYK